MRAGGGSNPGVSLPPAGLRVHKKTGRSSWKSEAVCGSHVSFVSTQPCTTATLETGEDGSGQG